MTSKTRETNESVNILVIRISGMLTLLGLFLAIFLLSGCQEEKFELTEPPADQVITINSPLADLVSRVTLKDGSSDNIIDNSSCTSFLLPITVVVNGLKVVVHSEADFDAIEKIFDDHDDDEDKIEIVFPVTVILADHSEITINSDDQLEDILEDCIDDKDDDIECLDFRYPFDLSVYDPNNQISAVITVTSDEQLHLFLYELEEEDLVSINFPIVVVLFNGEEVEVNTNDELEDIIKDAGDDCDEDDDNDNENDGGDAKLSTFLTDGEWIITYFFDDTLKTSLFKEFTLTFTADGSVVASNGILSMKGSWETYMHDSIIHLDLDFESESVFDEIGEDWQVIEMSATRIELEDSSGGDEVRLIIERK